MTFIPNEHLCELGFCGFLVELFEIWSSTFAGGAYNLERPYPAYGPARLNFGGFSPIRTFTYGGI